MGIPRNIVGSVISSIFSDSNGRVESESMLDFTVGWLYPEIWGWLRVENWNFLKILNFLTVLA